jgi:predicted kinase
VPKRPVGFSCSGGWATTMEAIIFIGLPGSGKSSFYKERFFSTHVRISLDLLKTRHRERRLFETCLATGQRVVIDNTNPTRVERLKYIQPAKTAGYAVVGFYFQSKVEDCLRRNSQRTDHHRVPDVAILAAAKKLELPVREEGFDRLFYVRLEGGAFIVEEWQDEVRRP